MSDQGDQVEALRTRNLRLLFEQQEYLLNDEIGYASRLHDVRKVATTLLLIVVGVTAIRVQLYAQPAALEPVLAPGPMAWVTGLIIAAMIFAFLGALFLFTERSLWRELRSAMGRGSGAGGALSVLYVEERDLPGLIDVSEEEMWRTRLDAMRNAYQRLRQSNRRVRNRLTQGVALVFLSILLALSASGLYIVAVGSVDSGSGDERRDQTTGPASDREGSGEVVPRTDPGGAGAAGAGGSGVPGAGSKEPVAPAVEVDRDPVNNRNDPAPAEPPRPE